MDNTPECILLLCFKPYSTRHVLRDNITDAGGHVNLLYAYRADSVARSAKVHPRAMARELRPPNGPELRRIH